MFLLSANLTIIFKRIEAFLIVLIVITFCKSGILFLFVVVDGEW